MAGGGEDREGLLVLLDPEREDSGIDSDEAERARRAEGYYSSDGSLSEDDPTANWIDREKDSAFMMEMAGFGSPEVLPLMPHKRASGLQSLEPVRRSPSPPLYVVELTTSDEDDDNSVFEVVVTNTHSLDPKRPKNLYCAAWYDTFRAILQCFGRK